MKIKVDIDSLESWENYKNSTVGFESMKRPCPMKEGQCPPSCDYRLTEMFPYHAVEAGWGKSEVGSLRGFDRSDPPLCSGDVSF